MQIFVNNSYSTVKTNNPAILSGINKFLSYQVKNYATGRTRLESFFIKDKGAFLTGLLYRLTSFLTSQGVKYRLVDCRADPSKNGSIKRKSINLNGMELFDFQVESHNAFLQTKRGILKLPTGAGKCLAKGTPILMFDGSIKSVESVAVGDLLMGPDSTPRKVLSLASGEEEMFKVSPIKGKSYIVNKSHILSLKTTGTEDIINISVKDYIGKSKNFKHLSKGWRTGVDFSGRPTESIITPYILGVWLGDGNHTFHVNGFSAPDTEIVWQLHLFAASIGLSVRTQEEPGKCRRCHITHHVKRPVHGAQKPNIFKDEIRRLNLCKNIHIPSTFKINSREIRLEVLAGLLDTDGYLTHSGYDIISKSKQLAEDIVYISRSLGLAAYMSESYKKCQNWTEKKLYYRASISGDCSVIPCKIPRKKAPERMQKKDVLKTGIKVESMGNGRYYGFEIDKDRLFLLGDFTVTHNTLTAAAIFKTLAVPTIWLTHRTNLMYQTAKVFAERIPDLKNKIGIIGNGQYSPNFITFSTTQSIHSALKKHHDHMKEQLGQYQMVIVDEAHRMGAKSFFEAVSFCNNAYYRLALTATPFMRDDPYENMMLTGTMGDIFHEVSPAFLIGRGLLAQPYFKFIPINSKKINPGCSDWHAVYAEGIVENKQRNSTIANVTEKLINVMGKKPLIIAQQMKHCHNIKSLTDAKGLNIEIVSGRDKAQARDKALNMLSDGRLDGIICTNIFDEGIDVKGISAVVLAGGGKSMPMLYQRIGRAARRKDKDNYCIVVDFHDNQHPILSKHSNVRYNAVKGQKGFKLIA